MRSIRARLVLGAGGLTLAALSVAWVVIATLLAGFVERRFDAELDSVAQAVMAGAAWEVPDPVLAPGDSVLAITPRPADARFRQPQSGWYWQVNGPDGALARSESLLSGGLPASAPAEYLGQALHLLERGFTAPGESTGLRVVIAMPRAVLAEETRRVTAPLALALLVLGLCLVLAGLATTRFGLLALDKLQGDIVRLRQGGITRLPEAQAEELSGLTTEINGLLDRNQAIVENARGHVANLAHALKTPVAALANKTAQDAEAVTLVNRIDRLLRWHLGRARRAATGAAQRHETADVRDGLDGVALVLRHEAAARAVVLDIDCAENLHFAGAAQDLEEMAGNLMENAVKWARGRVVATAGHGGPSRLYLRVEDDGPGIAPALRRAVLDRGTRLDEEAPGTGLGLAITADLVRLYGGVLTLERAQMGGLAVCLDLPARPAPPVR